MEDDERRNVSSSPRSLATIDLRSRCQRLSHRGRLVLIGARLQSMNVTNHLIIILLQWSFYHTTHLKSVNPTSPGDFFKGGNHYNHEDYCGEMEREVSLRWFRKWREFSIDQFLFIQEQK